MLSRNYIRCIELLTPSVSSWRLVTTYTSSLQSSTSRLYSTSTISDDTQERFDVVVIYYKSHRAEPFSCSLLVIKLFIYPLNTFSHSRKVPAQLEGKEWRELRRKQRLNHGKWRPKKRLTRYQMTHLKTLKEMQPDEWTNVKLANYFGICVSSVVRILKSKYEPPPEVQERQDARALQQRDERRKKFNEKLSGNSLVGQQDKKTFKKT